MARRSAIPSVIGGLIVVVAGVAIGVVEAMRWPKGSVWIVVGAAALSLLVLRRFTRQR